MRRELIRLSCALSLVLPSAAALAQACAQCGAGGEGAFNALANTSLAGGPHEFTTFNIAAGVTVTVTGNAPLLISATGAVTIDGVLSAAGPAGSAGVTSLQAGVGGIGVGGGGNGGDGVYSDNQGPLDGQAGTGPGAGAFGAGWSGGGGAGYAATGGSSGGGGGAGGPAYGDAAISTLLGGSGGGGGSGGFLCGSGGGGAGGGAISIRSCVSIQIGATGAIRVNGGDGGSDGTGNCGGGGGGSGGALVLTAPQVSNNGALLGAGGLGGASNVPGTPFFGGGGAGSDGRFRVDTLTGALGGSGTATPAPTLTTCTLPVQLQSYGID